MQKWIFALPITNEAEAEAKRKEVLQKQLERSVSELGETRSLGKDGVRIPYFPPTKLRTKNLFS